MTNKPDIDLDDFDPEFIMAILIQHLMDTYPAHAVPFLLSLLPVPPQVELN